MRSRTVRSFCVFLRSFHLLFGPFHLLFGPFRVRAQARPRDQPSKVMHSETRGRVKRQAMVVIMMAQTA